jgi:RHS repeat-associated protein
LYYFNANHLGSGSLITDENGATYQTLAYAPWGESLVNITHSGSGSYDEPYKFTGFIRDSESGLDQAKARYKNLNLDFISIDPMWYKYPHITSYVYCNNNPLSFVDPNGRDAILIVFPDYKIDPEMTIMGQKVPDLPLGHAGVLLIDNATGLTKYYEYGRYTTKDGTKGTVRSSDTKSGLTLPNVIIDNETGKPTQESLNKVLAKISANAGHNGKIEGAYIEGDFSVMNNYAQQKMKESNSNYTEYDKNRNPYDIWTNNCGTFAIDVIKQDAKAKKQAPWIISQTPDNIAEEYQDNFPYVRYNPQTKQTTSEIYE